MFPSCDHYFELKINVSILYVDSCLEHFLKQFSYALFLL